MTETQAKEARQIARVQEQERKIQQLECDLLTLQSETRHVRKELKAANVLRRRIINGDAEEQLDLPLQDGVAATSAQSEAWRDVPVNLAITITSALGDKLADAGVTTMGDLEDLRAGKNRDYPRGLLDLPKFGQKSLDKLEQQILDWLATRPAA